MDLNDINDGQIIYNQRFSGLQPAINIKNVTFNDCVFIDSKGITNGVQFNGCTFKNCMFSNSTFCAANYCKFVGCVFDNFRHNVNLGFRGCHFENLRLTNRQSTFYHNGNAHFLNCDFRSQENFFVAPTGISGDLIFTDHFNFENCCIDIKTINEIAKRCNAIALGGIYSRHELIPFVDDGEGGFDMPTTILNVKNLDEDARVNYIMALLTYDPVFQFDSLSKNAPVFVTSQPKMQAMTILDNNGAIIEPNTIPQFNFVIDGIRDMTIYVDLAKVTLNSDELSHK